MRSLFVRSLVAILTFSTLTVSHQATAQTENNVDTTPVPLFGNEGLGIGSLSLGGTLTEATSTTGYSHPALAQGFTVGEVSYILDSVDLGMVLPTDALNAMVNGGLALEIVLYEAELIDGKLVPSPTRTATFNPVPINTIDGAFTPNRKTLYKFGYLSDPQTKPVTLEAGKSYWLTVSYVPQEATVPVFYWQFAVPSGTNLPQNETPIDKSGSGFTYLGTIGKHAFGGNWIDHGTGEFANSGMRFTVNGYVAPPVIVTDLTPPTLDCYALSKGFFKNNFAGWPTLIADQGTVIEGQPYTVEQLKAMLSARSTRGNQIGQLASQLVAVHLSRALAIQTAGAPYTDWWNGWAPDSAEAQAAYAQAAVLINANIRFETYRGSLRVAGCLTDVGNLISALDGYISDNHCDDGSDGNDNDDRSCHRGSSKYDRDRDRCGKPITYERRKKSKSHECR